ncbi:hypothetical protein EJB05_13864 [Eragrostis curvula]|uniref:DUF4283 domain-containing protein n=1 Tax=Eragrostis curvula TaxID=38414 RepID=A0A5J9VZ68_9POAL|nr:hypothetical protein EJB05_13864 [Eragrostis curvula]
MLDLAKEVNRRKIVSGPGFELVVWPWNREEDSNEVSFNTMVQIKIQGIPAHAWRESSVHSLLDDYCAIQTIQMSKFLCGDMSSVHVTALTSSLDQIPPMAYLTIPEPMVGADLCQQQIQCHQLEPQPGGDTQSSSQLGRSQTLGVPEMLNEDSPSNRMTATRLQVVRMITRLPVLEALRQDMIMTRIVNLQLGNKHPTADEDMQRKRMK